MSIHKLKSLVPPPTKPFEVGSIDQWRVIEKKLGLVLPADYRDFVFTYGTGLFAELYRVYNPFGVTKWTNFSASIERACGWIRETKQDWPSRVPYPIFPEPSGLLPWGNDENGNNYYWITSGSPDSWLVVSDELRGEGFREYGRRMTDFLCEVLTGKIEALAGDYPRDGHLVFKPFS
jgi:hypothetical protein